MMLNLMESGIEIEMQHHEVGTAGQCEIDMRFGTLVTQADNLMKYKYIVKNTIEPVIEKKKEEWLGTSRPFADQILSIKGCFYIFPI